MVYRFKVTYEDHEDVFRYIEIKSSQSFAELHTAIQQCIGFDNSKPAVFYMSDDYWRKEEQISVENSLEEKARKNKIAKSKEQQKKKTIADYIDNPHQRFVYVFDPEREWTFLLELLKIAVEDKNTAYPQCVKSSGTPPKQYKPSTLPVPVAEDDLPKNELALPIETEGSPSLDLDKISVDSESEGLIIPLNEDDIDELTSEDDKPTGEEEDDENDPDTGEIELEENEPQE
jgi:Plasmid pRiA4b ORF-3-like protein